MPKGPRGEWRPADPVACAVHIGKLATGQVEETYEVPADRRRPPDPAAGGRARAAKMTAEERSASAKRASDSRWKGATT
jgi:hypothetical protein